ncbi:MAG: glutamyl-tRNA reductase [Armatimonadetes bacterium]|nr:glutamyl-tRNA reductase [Armatimonadota bacterium]MCX7966884.1 glutamyl-tRNA reductase [Armatimonadota bacterium]MDW8141842.1 glutamyl-tRNA reductase [Armatimonadota bacterium]
MHIIVVGTNHKVAPVEVREKVAFSEECLADAYRHFLANGVDEVVLLSTCNRTEVYAATREQISEKNLLAFWLSFFGFAPEELEGRFYSYRDQEVARHLFRVACGLDSMMLGETQILGQVKDAYEEAQKVGAAGTYLGELFRRAIKVGKRARNETAISKGAMSVGGAAVELAKHIFASLQTCTVLLVGAGKMGTDTAKALVQAGAKQLLVCNRTLSRAEELASELGGQVVPFDQLAKTLPKADIVIASTGAQHYVLTKPIVAEAIRQRRYRPLFLIDIAVPRNIDPEVGGLDNVFLFDIDDLEQVVQEYLEERRKEVPKVEALIDHELRNFAIWLGEQKAKPLILQILREAQQKAQRTLDEIFAELPDLSEAEKQTIAAKVRALTMWILDSPLRRIKQLAHSDGIMEAAEKLFSVEENSQKEVKSE